MMDIKEESILPLSNTTNMHRSSPVSYASSPSRGYTNGYAFTSANNSQGEEKKSDDAGRGRQRGQSNVAWLPAGTRQEATWQPREMQNGLGIDVPPVN